MNFLKIVGIRKWIVTMTVAIGCLVLAAFGINIPDGNVTVLTGIIGLFFIGNGIEHFSQRKKEVEIAKAKNPPLVGEAAEVNVKNIGQPQS